MKKFITMISIFMCALVITTDYDASELFKGLIQPSTNVSYAPVNPTAEEVETAAGTDIIVFEDENLEQCIADSMGVLPGTITTDMASTKGGYLSCDNKNIYSLEGIQYFTDMYGIFISGNNLTDLSPVTNLTNLSFIYARSNEITDVTPLANLTKLTTLEIEGNPISDISSLETLTNLTTLNVSNTLIDSNDLSIFTGLTRLTAGKNNFTNIDFLENMPNLNYLRLSDNNLEDEDLLPLLNAKGLTDLSLSGNNINTLDTIVLLENLEILGLSYNNISDISPVSKLTKLQSLYISHNAITDLSPLSENTLTYLSAANQRIFLDDIVVKESEELKEYITLVDGTKLEVSLGVPQIGNNRLSTTFSENVNIGDTSTIYSGTIYQNVNYIPNTIISSKDTILIEEGKALTDVEILKLFEVESSHDLEITVDSSTIDFSTAGTYQIIFTDDYGAEFVASLTLTDVLPIVEVSVNELTIPYGSTLDDIKDLIVVSATEIVENDLLDTIIYNDENIDYQTPGVYDLELIATDNENNQVSTIVTITIEPEVIEEDSEVIEEDSEVIEEDSEVVEEDSEVIEEDSEVIEEVVEEDSELVSEEKERKQMLLQTGSNLSVQLISLILVIITLGYTKTILRKL